jgi:hypothetical protein
LIAQKLFKIEGDIVDKETNENIPYVSVCITNKPIGVTSDEFGFFNLHSPFINAQIDSLSIIHLGYMPYKMSLNGLEGTKLEIKLVKEHNELGEISLSTKYTVFDLIKEALDKVEENYYEEKPIYLKNFLKMDWVEEKKEQNIKQLEAYLTVYRPKINGNSLAKIKIDKARKKIDFKNPMPSMWLYEVLLDFIEKDALFFAINKKNFSKYDYKMKGIELLNGKHNYCILVTKKDSSKYFLSEIYIDTTSLAFSRFTVQKEIDNQKNMGTPLYQLLFQNLYSKYEINYQEIKGKWYLNNMKSSSKTYAKDTKETFYTYLEYKVQHIEREDVTNLNPLKCLHEKSVIETEALLWDDPTWFEDKTKKNKKK